MQDDEALFLYSLVRSLRLSRVLEIGGLSGYSARNFLRAMEPTQGVVYTVGRHWCGWMIVLLQKGRRRLPCLLPAAHYTDAAVRPAKGSLSCGRSRELLPVLLHPPTPLKCR